MSPMYSHDFPFESSKPSSQCGPLCTPGPSGVFCGSPDGCTPCELEDINFLNCYIVGFSGKLGLGGSESSVNIDLVERSVFPCPSASPCVSSASPNPSSQSSPKPSCEPNSSYSGQLGHIYTFQVGGFCFTGILANHNYSENDGGYRYKVSLTDGRQALGNVTVILNGYYGDVPASSKPNLINAVYELEKSAGNDTCGSGDKCKDFGKSGSGYRGIFVKKALEAINKKVVQLPISNACLIMDLTKLIEVASPYQRTTSIENSVLELITLAAEEVGHDFFVRIVGNTIEVVPIDRRKQVPPRALFDFMEDMAKDNPVSDREYGEEMTFEKSKRFVIGTNYNYLVLVDNDGDCDPEQEPDGGPCPGTFAHSLHQYTIDNEPGDQTQGPVVEASTTDVTCDILLKDYLPK